MLSISDLTQMMLYTVPTLGAAMLGMLLIAARMKSAQPRVRPALARRQRGTAD